MTITLPSSTLTLYYPAETKEVEKQSKYGTIKVLSLKKFLELVENEPLKFYNHTELIILHDGRIILAEPSHTVVLHNLVRYATKHTEFDFSIGFYSEELLALSKAILVWNNQQRMYSFDEISDEQMATLNTLVQNKLINLNLITSYSKLRHRFESYFEEKYKMQIDEFLDADSLNGQK